MSHEPEKCRSAQEQFRTCPSRSVAPWVNGTIAWGDTHIFAVIAGMMMAIAAQIDVDIRWGGDWDSDRTFKDQTFIDMPHFEIDVQ